MFTRPIFLFFICLSVVQCVKAQQDYLDLFSKRENHKYCGRKLVAAVKLICGSIYNSMFKRSEISDNALRNFVGGSGGVDYPFKERSSAEALASTGFRRRKRGIYDECCRKSCSVQELAQYCGD